MLIVNNTGTTTVTVTLYEMSQNKVNPYFTWLLQRKGSNDVIVFQAPDLSYAPYYWNQYNITVATASIGLTNGIIPIFEGEWEYNVYEMQNQYDLNIENAVGLVENGILVCGLTFSTTEPQLITNTYTPLPVFRPQNN